MKKTSWLFAVLVVAALLPCAFVSMSLSGCGCSSNNGQSESIAMEPAAGTYEITAYKQDGVKVASSDFKKYGLDKYRVVLNKDGTGTTVLGTEGEVVDIEWGGGIMTAKGTDGKNYTVTYEADGKELIVDYGNKVKVTYELDS